MVPSKPRYQYLSCFEREAPLWEILRVILQTWHFFAQIRPFDFKGVTILLEVHHHKGTPAFLVQHLSGIVARADVFAIISAGRFGKRTRGKSWKLHCALLTRNGRRNVC